MWHNNYTSLGSIFVSPGSVTLHKLRKWGIWGKYLNISYEDSWLFQIFFLSLHTENRSRALRKSVTTLHLSTRESENNDIQRVTIADCFPNSPQLTANSPHRSFTSKRTTTQRISHNKPKKEERLSYHIRSINKAVTPQKMHFLKCIP